jgi:DNA repair photolyase
LIISASRRTDLPAFYGEWFMNRVREGFLYVRNPFNAGQFTRVDLSPRNVDVIVFWTKNPAPMMKYLDELDERGYPYYFQFTLTAYPTILEPFVPPIDALVSTFTELSERIGPDRLVWRFDPILVSDVTDENMILKTFSHIAGRIKGCTGRVVISFAHYYKTVVGNLNRLQKAADIRFYDISSDEEKTRRIARSMADVAHEHAMEILSCAGKLDLREQGVLRGKCIDDELITRVFGISVPTEKDRYQRAECGCVRSQDIGQYDTCVHDCVYCYANSHKNRAHMQKAAHDPECPFLIPAPGDPKGPDNRRVELDLFSLTAGS